MGIFVAVFTFAGSISNTQNTAYVCI